MNKSRLKNKIKSMPRLIIVTIYAVIFYIISLVVVVFVCTHVFSEMDQDTFISIGVDQGRRQVLDSLKHPRTYGTEKIDQKKETSFKIGSDGVIHARDAL